MEIRLAKTAGFCFGVDRAVKLTYGLLDEGRKVATLGPLIHNPQTVEDLESRGALVADTPADVPTGYEVVIRSHGVPRSIYDELEARGCTYHDATCPFVKKIQKIASEAEAAGASAVMPTVTTRSSAAMRRENVFIVFMRKVPPPVCRTAYPARWPGSRRRLSGSSGLHRYNAGC